MAIAIEDMPGEITKVVLDGKLDIEGAAAVDMKMNVLASRSRLVLVDLQNVSFLGSMGIRALLAPARAIRGRGGKMVLFGPIESVQKALTTAGIDKIIPIHPDLQSALAALQ